MAGIAASAGRQFRALLGVRRRLALRQFKGRTSETIAAIIIPLIFVPLSILIGVGLYNAFTRPPEPWPIEILAVVLTAIWGTWIVFPMIAGSFSDVFDLTKLIVYPIHRRALVGGMFVGTLFDLTTLLTIPVFVAVIIAWGKGVSFLFVLLALVVLWANMVTGYQLIATTMFGIFRSRRFREFLIAGGSLLGLGIWSLHFWVDNIGDEVRGAFESGNLSAFSPLSVLQWTPPGAVTRAIEHATRAEFGGAFVWLGFALLPAIPLFWLWWRVLVRVTVQGGVLFTGTKGRGEQAPSSKPATNLGATRSGFGELVAKELRIWWRSPYVRMQMLQGIIMPVVFVILFLRDGVTDKTLAFLPAAFLLMSTAMGYTNVLGSDGTGIATILVSPLRRERIFQAKAAAFGAFVGVPFTVAVIVALWMIPSFFTVAGTLAGVSIALITTTVFNYTSVLFPYPVQDDGKRGSMRRQGGFTAVLAMLGGMISASIISAPIWIMMGIAAVTDNTILALVTGVLGVLFGTLVFWGGTKHVARTFTGRESEIYLALKPRQHE